MTTRVLLNINHGGYHLSDECVDRLTELLNADPSSAGIVHTRSKVYSMFVRPDYKLNGEYIDYRIPFRSHPLLLQVIDEIGLDRCATCVYGPPIIFKLVSVPIELLKFCKIKSHDGEELYILK